MKLILIPVFPIWASGGFNETFKFSSKLNPAFVVKIKLLSLKVNTVFGGLFISVIGIGSPVLILHGIKMLRGIISPAEIVKFALIFGMNKSFMEVITLFM